MRTRLVTFASALVLLLCVAGWVRSYLPEYSTVRAYDGSAFFVCYNRDAAPYIDPLDNPTLEGYRGDAYAGRPPPRWDSEQILTAARRWKPAAGVGTIKWRGIGFELIATTGHLRWGYFVLGVPFWALCLPPAIAAGWGVARSYRRRNRRRAGLCRQCGYDLRATPDRCPECGTIPRL
ncbi:MAG TPA: hypothetical protein VH475_29015 [Tepidisphaeraceae bacterium]